MSGTPSRSPLGRRTQESRSAETRAKLIEATLAVLVERGYANATAVDIAAAAGVSRGALHHHFVGKDDLVAQAVDHLLKQSTAEIAAMAESVRSGALPLRGFLDRLWAMFRGRLFLVTLEHVTAARHNAELRAQLVPLVRDFHAALDRIWRGFFEGAGLPGAEVEALLNATLCLLRGMGVQSVLRQDDAYFRGLIDLWERTLSVRLAARTKAA
jgi:AcrR family transcriptional regulator